jgi:ribosomal protein S18 acetylase RimI-like enzyme
VKQNDIEIRLGRVDEAVAVASILKRSFAEYEMLYTPEGFRATTPDSDVVSKRMSEGPLWIASIDEVLVGTGAAVAEGVSLYIRGMAVLPSARGNAVGESMLNHIQDHAVSSGCSRMFLSTTPFLTRAIRLYERFGFRRTADGPHDLFGTPLFTMEKIL